MSQGVSLSLFEKTSILGLFTGTSDNSVKTQLWIAISIYVLVAIIKKRLGLDHSLYTILRVLHPETSLG